MVLRAPSAANHEPAPIDLSKKDRRSPDPPRQTRSDVKWREGKFEEEFSSPDSGLHRDSPGEEEDVSSTKPTSPPARKQTLIPLSLIRARYKEEKEMPKPEPPHVLTKRARLEEMVTNIKKSTRKTNSDDESSSGDHVTSSDEVAEEPTDLRRQPGKDLLEDEPCNLVSGKETPFPDSDPWKGKGLEGLSAAEAARLYAVDPEAYQQQIMQLQLTSAAMLGNPGGLLKAMGSYPPWLYLGYYSQLLHSFQAQEIIRQYAIQSQSLGSTTVSQGEKVSRADSPQPHQPLFLRQSPSVPRTLPPAGYSCQSPMSPASLSEGPTAIDSDSSLVGQSGGKRAPRAMTGRHVRTGTGASPSTLQTLRHKIQERQRMKAQQIRHDLALQSHVKGKGPKYMKKPKK